MPTTAKNFLALTAAAGSGYGANGVALAVSPAVANVLAGSAGLATLLDRPIGDLSAAGYAKNGAVVMPLAASTPVTADLTSLSSQPVNAGDTSFAAAKDLILTNLSAQPVTVSPGATNGFSGPLGGTSPTFTLPANAQVRWRNPAGWTVDSTHKNLKFDPGSSPATVALCIGGA